MECVWWGYLIKTITKVPYGLVTEQLYLSSYTNKYFFTFYIMERIVYDKCIETEDRKKNIDDGGSGAMPKAFNRKSIFKKCEWIWKKILKLLER